MSSTVPDDAPKPRLSHVKKWSDFNGYGFNLHAEKGKAGQFIGKVDENSPAEAAGLKEGDRIVEVNGTNIGNENHQQVVQRIKAVPNETKMLVVDSATDQYYKERKIVVRGDMSSVERITAPDTSSGTPEVDSGPSPPLYENAVGDGAAVAESPSKPRQCHVKIWPDFAGYGFNLHAEKGKPGQFIGKVDEGSPADLAGLREGDRIVEVNEQPIAQDNHQQVVQKIKQSSNETKLLVVDKEGDKYYRENSIPITHSSPDVLFITCPDSKPTVNGDAQVEAEVNHDSEEVDTQEAYGYEDQQHNGYIASFDQTDDTVHEEYYQKEETEQERDIEETTQTVVESESQETQPVEQPEADYENAEAANDTEATEITEVNGDRDAEAVAAIAAVSTAADDENAYEPDAGEKQEQMLDELGDYEVVEFQTQRSESPPPSPPPGEPERRTPTPEPVRALTPEPARAPTPEPVIASVPPPLVEEKKIEEPTRSEPEPSPPTTPVSPGPVTIAGIEFAGSVAEAKARASRKKKVDPRVDNSLSMKDKYDMFQRL